MRVVVAVLTLCAGVTSVGAAHAASGPDLSITGVSLTCKDGAASVIEYTVNNNSTTAGVYDYKELINDRLRAQTNYFEPDHSSPGAEYFGSGGFTGLTGTEPSYTVEATGSAVPDGQVETFAATTIDNTCLVVGGGGDLGAGTTSADFEVTQQPTCANDYTSGFRYTGDGANGFSFAIKASVNGGTPEIVDGAGGSGPMTSPLPVDVADIDEDVPVGDGDQVALQLVYYIGDQAHVAEGVATSFVYEVGSDACSSGGGTGTGTGGGDAGFDGPIVGFDSVTSTTADGTATATYDGITATAQGPGTLSVAEYQANPEPADVPNSAGAYFDVKTSADADFDTVVVTMCSLSGGSTLYWWNGNEWSPIQPQTYDPRTDCIEFTVSDGSTPSLDDLHGTVFGISTTPQVDREGGANRVETAVVVSQATFPDNTAKTVVLSGKEKFPDALSGGPLAVAEDGPLLLTDHAALQQVVADEIQRVLPAGSTVYVLGGEAALSSQVSSAVVALGYDVTRLGGPNRYSTSAAVARELGSRTAIFFAGGKKFPDALSASAAAAKKQGVVLLTRGGSVPDPTRKYVQAHPGLPTYAVGGPAASAVKAAHEYVGADRYATAAETATKLFPAPSVAGMASGRKFPDALSAAGQMGRLGGPVLLTKPTGLNADTRAYLSSVKSGLRLLDVFGGTAALPNAIAVAARAALQ